MKILAKSKTAAEQLPNREILTGELAAIIGKTPQWIRQLTRDGVLKQVGRGKYLLSDAVQAYILHASGGKEEDNKPRYIDHKTEHERIKKEIAELDLAEMRGELHRSADVERLMTDMILTTKSKLQAVPSRLAPQLDGEPAAVIQKAMTSEIGHALASLVDYTPDLFAKEGRADPDG